MRSFVGGGRLGAQPTRWPALIRFALTMIFTQGGQVHPPGVHHQVVARGVAASPSRRVSATSRGGPGLSFFWRSRRPRLR